MNEYLFDPFRAEEEDIKAKQLKAMTIALRGLPTRAMGDYTSRINDIAAQVNAERELESIPELREALSEKYRQSLARTLSRESPEVQELGSTPQGAPIAIKQLSDRLERENIARERQALRDRLTQGGVEGQGVGTSPELAYQIALEEAQHPNPKISGPGKVLFESLKPVDPKNIGRVGPTGVMGVILGSPEALRAQQNAMGDMVEIEMGDGSKQRVPKSEAINFLLGGAKLVGPATRPVASPGAPTYPGTSAPVASPTGPVAPPSGPPQIPPGAPPAPPPQFNFSGTPEQIAQAQAIADKDIASRTQAPQPTPIVQPSGAVRPSGPVGSTPASMDIKQFEEIRQENEKALQAWSAKSNTTDLRVSLAKLKELNQKPMYSGYHEVPMALENAVSMLSLGKMSKSEEGKNVEQFEKSSGDIIAGLLPQYGSGNGISDADMRGAAMRVSNPRMDPESRAEVIAVMEDKVAFAEYANQRVPVLVRQGNYTLAAAKDIAFMEYEEMKKKKQAAGAAQEAAPGVTPQRPASSPLGPVGPEGQTNYMRNPASPLSQTMDAFVDVLKNTGRGAANLFGFGDRQAAVADVERQEARAESEPIYGGARQVANIGKYGAAVPFGPLGGALVAGGLAATEPSTSTMGQIIGGAAGAAEGGVLGKAGNLLKVAPLVKELRALEDQFVRMAPNAKGRAALGREIEGLKLQIERLGGTIGELPGKALDLVTNPLRGVLNVLKGR